MRALFCLSVMPARFGSFLSSCWDSLPNKEKSYSAGLALYLKNERNALQSSLSGNHSEDVRKQISSCPAMDSQISGRQAAGLCKECSNQL